MISIRARSFLRALFVASLTVASVPLVSCAGPQKIPSPPCELAQKVGLIIKASARLNPDEEGRALPTIIRIYQLKSPSSLENAQFEDIWKKDKETLGEDLLKKDEIVMYPDRITKKEFQRDPKATVVAAVVIVRHPSGISWRTIFELPPPPGETRCAALQDDPSAGPTPPENPRYYLLMEDYRVEPGDDTLEDDAARNDRRRGSANPPSAEELLERAEDIYTQGRTNGARALQNGGDVLNSGGRSLLPRP